MSHIYVGLFFYTVALSGCGTVSVQNGNTTRTSGGPKVTFNVSGTQVTTFYGASLKTTRFNESNAGWVAGRAVQQVVLVDAHESGYISCNTATILSSSVRDTPSNETNNWVEDWTVDFCGVNYTVAINGSGKDSLFSSVKYHAEPAILIGKSTNNTYQEATARHAIPAKNNALPPRPLLNTSGPSLDEIYASLSRKEKAKVNRLPPADRAEYLASLRDAGR